jgi:hypothetical protein
MHCDTISLHCAITRGSTSDVLDSQDQKKIKDAKKSKKKKTEKLTTTIMVAISTSYFPRNMILFYFFGVLFSFTQYFSHND